MERYQQLIAIYLSGEANSQEVQELDLLLQSDATIRAEFYQQTNAVAALEEAFDGDSLTDNEYPRMKRSSPSKALLIGSILATIVLAGVFFFKSAPEKTIATLVANEEAAWESLLPTQQGSELAPGLMKLKSGVAKIHFSSGAEVTLEAPAEFELIDRLRARLLTGSAVIEVPDSAKGFTLETPEGFAVDHGTAFAVTVGKDQTDSFEVLEGEISIHTAHGDSLFLTDNQSALIDQGSIQRLPSPSEGTMTMPRDVFRIGTNSKSASIIRCNDFTHLHPDYLMVKRDGGKRDYERRSVINFSVAGVDWQQVESVKLQLNLVPCGLGYASRLKAINQFNIYGLAGELSIDWAGQIKWQEIPSLSSAEKLASFEIPRSRKRGAFSVQSQELLNYLRINQSDSVTFILTRETEEQQVLGLVHAFASDSHPEAAGPSLEIRYIEK